MPSVKIFITPSSITIYDGNKNKLIVRKTSKGIEYHTDAEDKRTLNSVIKLQTAIKEIITEKSKDNYAKRFAKLSKRLTVIETHSFVTITNQLLANKMFEEANEAFEALSA